MHEALQSVAVRLHVMAPNCRDKFQSIIVRIIIMNSEFKVVPEHTWWRQVWGLVVQTKAFVSSALDIGEWPGSRHNHVIPGDRAPGNH
jgi:hypothetical protein